PASRKDRDSIPEGTRGEHSQAPINEAAVGQERGYEGKHRLIAMIPSASTSDTLGGQDARTGSTERARIETQSALREHISKIAAAVFKDTVAKSLRALVLTGSLARGEAGFDIHEGRCKVRGDSEFLVVLTDVAADPSASRKRAIIEALHEQLRLAGIDCLVSVGFV